VGFFKNLNKTMEAAQGAAENAKKMQDQAMTNQAAYGDQLAYANSLNNPAPIADNDPMLAPINGLSIHRYAELAYEMQHLGGDIPATTAYAESHGVAPGTWQDAATAWSQRMMQDPRVNKRFNELWRECAAKK
jgi:hypothetical protein